MKNRLSARIHLVLPQNFLKALDEQAKTNFMSRSEYIRAAVMEKMGVLNLADPQKRPSNNDPDKEFDDFMNRLYGR